MQDHILPTRAFGAFDDREHGGEVAGGTKSLAIMFLIHLQGAFAHLSYLDRRERQRADIEKAKAKRAYRSRARWRGRVRRFPT